MIYRVDFLDHCQDYNMPVECAVYGLLIAEDEESITLEVWSHTDDDQREDFGNDNCCFTLVRGAIKRLTPMFEGQPVDHNTFPLSTSSVGRAG
jgi:hypothetical protein